MSLNEIATFLILSFTVYRATRFFQKDSLLEEWRSKLLAVILGPPVISQKWDISQGPPPPPAFGPPKLWRVKLYELFTCPYCLSAHGAWIAVLVAIQFMSIPLPVFMWVAVAGGSMAAWRYVEDE